MKARHSTQVKAFEDIPNIGPAMAADFALLGMAKPADLKGRDPLALYKELCRKTGARHDPCVLDTFIAAVDFMNGGEARPWWAYTEERKKKYPISRMIY
jgi:hypothetical protein